MSSHHPLPKPKLCPYLIEAELGTFIARGRARFPEGVKAPMRSMGAPYDVVTIPAGTFTWRGESFELRVEGVASKHSDLIENEIAQALYELAERPNPGSGECRYRVDSLTWEAPAELEDRMIISGTSGTLICRDGVPIAVEFEGYHPDDFESIAPAFRAIFAGVATLCDWQLTARPLARGKAEDWRHFDGRAEVVVDASFEARLVAGGAS